ncbi:hypothetical protein CIG75_19525 [Tumebacillus algifaecis]|uniref:Uncharacterized protein n=1 Tax=Tumebacillus algifaecis TaxID=1214604 RepID=A0A223D5K6_9BACL|nr:hypothetical protein [Tumebacillus algifaecis]ASS76889.1 hypothetical protein CIG75_19525 [Tumebacillus algifaecis]
MNCSQVQEAIWCGDLQPDAHLHLATCAACREELQRVHQLNEEIEHVTIPPPTRSLIPAREEIEHVVKQNKKNRFSNWLTIGTIAAAILLAIKTGDVRQTPVADLSMTSTDSHLSDRHIPASRSLAVSHRPFQAEGTAIIDPDSNPSFREEAESIRTYLNQHFDQSSLRTLTIETYTRDTIEGDTQTGRLTLWVQNQPGQVSVYGKGDRPFRTQQYIELQKIQGLWTVTATSDIPFDYTLHRQKNYRVAFPSTWQAVPNLSVEGALSFEQDGKILGGITPTPLRPGEENPVKAVQLPALTNVIQSGLESYRTEDTVKYLLKRAATAADSIQTPLEVHTYFLRGTIAYDVWLYNDQELISPETALAITHSFQTSP